jgi:hypothetical protein
VRAVLNHARHPSIAFSNVIGSLSFARNSAASFERADNGARLLTEEQGKPLPQALDCE